MDKKVQSFIDSLVPKNIPKKKRQELFDEYVSHIYDKIDFYKDIGYEKETATEKALSEMGDTEEIKEEIKLSFENLYKERTLFAVLIGLSVFVMNILMGGLGFWIMSADSKSEPQTEGVFLSFVSVISVIFLVSYLYIKGYRKSLIAVGVSNLFIGGTLLICFYPQCFIFGLIMSVEYILELLTPLMLREFNLYYSSTILSIGSIIFTLAVSTFCFILSEKLKKNGLPKDKAKNISGAVIAAVLISGLVAIIPYERAEKYFDEYPVWFQEYDDDIREEEQLIFDSFSEKTTYEEARKKLLEKGYTDTESYKETLSKNKLEQFTYNLDNMDISFPEPFEIFFNKEYIEKNLSEYKDGNSFFVIGKNEKGMLSLKGIGVLSSENKADDFGRHRHYGNRQDNIKKCMEYFESVKKGDTKENVLSKFGGEQGEIYSLITEYEKNKKAEYVKVYLNGDCFEEDYKDFSAFLEFTFENEILTKGSMFYEQFVGDDLQTKTYEVD